LRASIKETARAVDEKARMRNDGGNMSFMLAEMGRVGILLANGGCLAQNRQTAQHDRK